MVIKKSTKITALCAVCALAIIGGGYAVSHAMVNASIDKIEKVTALYLNKATNAPVDNRFSVVMYEKHPGVFNRDFHLIAVQGQKRFVMPIHMKLGYLRCDFVLDVMQAKLNNENIIDSEEFDRLTRAETTGHLSLLGSKLYIHSELDWRNSLDFLKSKYPYPQENITFNPEGNGIVDVIIDANENIVTSGTLSHFTSDDGVAIRHVSFVNESSGLIQVDQIGKTQVYIEDLVAYPKLIFGQDAENRIRTIALTSEATKPNTEGDFALSFDLAVSNFYKAKDIKVKGRMNGLNIGDLASLKENVNLMSATTYLLTHNASLEIKEGSSVTLVGPVQNADHGLELQDFVFLGQAAVAFSSKNNISSIDGQFSITTDKDVNTVIGGDIYSVQDLFKVKDGASSLSVVFSYPIFSSQPAHIELNGEVLN